MKNFNYLDEAIAEYVQEIYGKYGDKYKIFSNPFVYNKKAVSSTLWMVGFRFLDSVKWKEVCDEILSNPKFLNTYSCEQAMQMYIMLHMASTFVVNIVNDNINNNDELTKVFGDSSRMVDIAVSFRLHDIKREDIQKLMASYQILENYINGLRTVTLGEKISEKLKIKKNNSKEADPSLRLLGN